jgi:hypothetical protein
VAGLQLCGSTRRRLRRRAAGDEMRTVMPRPAPLPPALAILNGFGISVGDSVIGLQALWAARALGHVTAPPVLIRRPGLRPMVDLVYPLAADFCSLRPLPAALEAADLLGQGFDHVIDIRDFAFDPGFRGVAMIDFFLTRLGLDPATVPPALRRNTWLAPRVAAHAPPADRGYALVCPSSSMALRDMPDAVHRAIQRRLLGRGLRVLTQGAPVEGAARAPAMESMEALCGLVAGAACIISTDTAMVHLADAFAVPCLAFFTTHRPEWRVRDYPLCTAMHLTAPGLPEALEFQRGPEDLAAVLAAWQAASGEVAAMLERFLDTVEG